MQQENGSNRIVFFDHLRVFAIFLIIILHTASYCWYDTDIHSGTWLILNGFKALTDHAVLLFVMISGTLFLGRDVPLKQIYLKYVLRMVCSFIVWSFIYSLVSNYKFGVRSVLMGTLASHYHLWFLPMIAGLYICLPILRLFVKTEKRTNYFLVISFFFAFLFPSILKLMADFGNIQINGYLGGQTISSYASYLNARLEEAGVYMVCGYSFYFIIGYYLSRAELSKIARYILYILGGLGFAVTYILTVLDNFSKNYPSDTYHENFNIAVMLSAVATFILFRQLISQGKDGRSARLIAKLSKYSFAAYLIHALVIELIDQLLGINALSFFPLLSVPVIGIVTFVISFAVSALLNKIPFINKYIV